MDAGCAFALGCGMQINNKQAAKRMQRNLFNVDVIADPSLSEPIIKLTPEESNKRINLIDISEGLVERETFVDA